MGLFERRVTLVDNTKNAPRKRSVKQRIRRHTVKPVKDYVRRTEDHFLKPFQTQTVKTDFKQRRRRQEAELRKRRRQQDAHPYAECTDDRCKRQLCKAYKEGIAARSMKDSTR